MEIVFDEVMETGNVPVAEKIETGPAAGRETEIALGVGEKTDSVPVAAAAARNGLGRWVSSGIEARLEVEGVGTQELAVANTCLAVLGGWIPKSCGTAAEAEVGY